jgi:hypothetical protein
VRHIDNRVQLTGDTHAGLALAYVFDQAKLDRVHSQPSKMYLPQQSYGIGMAWPSSSLKRVPHTEGAGPPRPCRARHAGILGDNTLRGARQVWQ